MGLTCNKDYRFDTTKDSRALLNVFTGSFCSYLALNYL